MEQRPQHESSPPVHELPSESEEQLRAVLQATKAGLYDLNLRTGQAKFSPEYATMLGYDPVDFNLNLDRWTGWLHPEDRDRTLALLQSCIQGGMTDYETQFRMRTRTGDWKWIQSSGKVAAWGPAGQPVRLIGIHVDITERKRADEALKASQALLNASQSTAHVGSWELNLSTHQIFWSEECYRIHGFDPATFQPTFEHLIEQVLPEDRALIHAHDQETATTKVFQPFEFRFLRPDGVVRRVYVTGRVICDSAGVPVKFYGTQQDITERKRAEEALRLANRQLRMLSECNEALVRGADEPELFRTVCRIAVETGGYRMAWVGLAEDDPAKTVRPVAWAGVDDGYIARANISWADTKHGRGPIGIAIRTGRPCPVQNILDDPGFAPWRLEAAKRGFASACALPLTANGRTFGSLCVYSSQPDAFDTAEATLLQKLADNLAFGVAALRVRQEREQAEQHRRDAEGLYRTVFQTSPDGIVLLDLDGRITFASPKALLVIGVAAIEEVTGRSIDDFIAPDDHERVHAAFRRVLNEQYRTSSEYIVRRTDGSSFIGEFNAALLRDAEGRPKGVLGIMRDTTARKRAEEALHSNERKLAEIFRASPEFISVSTLDEGRILEFNDTFTKLLGYEQHEVIGRTSVGIGLWLSPDERLRVLSVVREKGRVRNLEVKWRKKSGEVFDVLLSMAPINIEGQACLISIATDIGELKRSEHARLEMERRLLHAQKLESLGVLAGGIAHDFNNLLMAILGNLDLALMDLSPVSPARSSIEQSATAARRAADLTRQMLAYSGRASFDVRRISLSELVAENAHLFRACISKIVVLNVQLDHGLPLVDADSGQIQQVIMNLITNASEAIGERPGAISLSTGVQTCEATALSRSRVGEIPAPGRFVWLEVADTGCGMDQETQLRLFDPFFSTKSMGRGLGMSAILGIVRAHRGAIFVDSTIGKGTTIRVLFPAGNAQPAGAGPSATSSAPLKQSGGRPVTEGTVLVVDDEDMVRNVCALILRKLGWQVIAAPDGQEALKLYKNRSADITCVILDQSMPQMDGATVFRELRAINPGVKVILSSGYSNDQSSGKHLTAECPAGFIQKPYSVESLRQELTRVLKGA